MGTLSGLTEYHVSVAEKTDNCNEKWFRKPSNKDRQWDNITVLIPLSDYLAQMSKI